MARSLYFTSLVKDPETYEQRRALQVKWDRDEGRKARRAILEAQMAQSVTRDHRREYPVAV